MSVQDQYFETAALTVIKNLEKRNMAAEFCATAEEARKRILDMIPEGSSVSWGGSETLDQLAVKDELKKRDLVVLDRAEAEDPQQISEIYHKALAADFYLMSSNALTRDGKLVNIDGRGNRLAALIYGPEKVVVVAGMNKVSPDVDSAFKRIRFYASPMNARRLERDTPCTRTGYCSDCQSSESICCQEVVTRRSIVPGRIHVILVGENLGF